MKMKMIKTIICEKCGKVHNNILTSSNFIICINCNHKNYLNERNE